MASSVAESIVAAWTAAGLGTSIVGGLWTGEAPSSVDAMPYAVLTQVADTAKGWTTDFRVYSGVYQLSVMADDLAEAETLCRSAAAAFHKAVLALDGFMSCLAGDVRWTLGVGLGLGGEDCWTCYVELEIMYIR